MGPINQLEPCLYTLTAREANIEDSGDWRCELTNTFGTSTARCSVKVIESADIDKEIAPSFVEYLENVAVIEDKPIKFRCKATGKPEPEVKWFRNEIPIDSSGFGTDSRYQITRGADGEETLELRRAKLRDAGIYKCKIMNSAGWAACDAKLLVTEDPDDDVIPYIGRTFDYTLADKIKARRAAELPNEADVLASRFCDSDAIRKFLMKWSIEDDQTLGFPVHLSSKCVVAGASVVLGCLVKGKPPLRIRWYKNNKEVFEDGRYFIRSRQGFLSLEIPCAQEEDTGNYMCEVRNEQGKIYTSCYLQVEPVLEVTDEVPTKPEFIKPMKRLTVNDGELIRFRVTVKAFPAPGFKWFKDGLEVHDTERITTEVMPNGVAQLIIENASIRDIGLYTCEAHNFAGRARNMVRVSVRDKWETEAWKNQPTSGADIKTSGSSVSPEKVVTNGVLPSVDYEPSHRGGVFSYEPMFTLKLPKDMTIEDKDHFLLECCCNGNPKPTVAWYKDSKPLEEDGHYRFLSLGDWYGLEVLEARPGDAGIYTAIVENEAGELMSSCTVDMKFFKVQPEEGTVPVHKTGELTDRIAGIVAIQSEHDVELFRHEVYGLAQIIASSNLCNTEIDWTAIIDKEIEVIDTVESPSFTQTLPDRITPNVNDTNVTLTCVVAGKPCPRVEWFKDDKLIDGDICIVKGWNFKEGLATLTFKKVTSEMAGEYSCVAYSDISGHAKTVCQVVVKGTQDADTVKNDTDNNTESVSEAKSLPEFKIKLQDTETKAGDQVKLEVKTEGFPTPEIKWYKNDQEIPTDLEKYSITSDPEGLHTLIIANVHLSDSDCYKCEAINECGAVSTCAHVVVQEECEVNTQKGSAPSFVEPVHSVTARVGQEAVLKCTAEGIPAPKLRWVKDERLPIVDDGRIKVIKEGLTTTLKITAVEESDAGMYYCMAENEHGKVKSCANLKVNVSGNSSRKQSTSGTAELDDKRIGSNKTKDSVPGSEASDGLTIENKGRSQTDGEVVNCTADTPYGEIGFLSSENGEINNKYKRLPKFVVRPLSQWVVSKQPLAISFQAVKSGDTEVQWFHNGREVTNGRYIIDVKPLKD